MHRSFFYLVLLCFLCGCTGPKYSITFQSGKELDFNQGKWLLNEVESNSRKFEGPLYTIVLEEYSDILGDSLVELRMLRGSKLLPLTIDFDQDQTELIELGTLSDCDYLINVKGVILTNNAGGLNIPSNDSNYYATNESEVEIKIYDLKNGIELSSSMVHSKLVNEGSHFDNRERIPSLNLSAQSAMLKGARKLIRAYGRYGE